MQAGQPAAAPDRYPPTARSTHPPTQPPNHPTTQPTAHALLHPPTHPPTGLLDKSLRRSATPLRSTMSPSWLRGFSSKKVRTNCVRGLFGEHPLN